MTSVDVAREIDEHMTEVRNFCSHLTALAERLIDAGGVEQAGQLLVLDRIVAQRNTKFVLSMSVGAPDGDGEQAEPARKRRAAPAAGGAPADKHRHTFVDGKCTKCGKLKGAGGRGQRKPGSPADVEARTPPLPLRTLGVGAADRFAGGGMGSSGTGDR